MPQNLLSRPIEELKPYWASSWGLYHKVLTCLVLIIGEESLLDMVEYHRFDVEDSRSIASSSFLWEVARGHGRDSLGGPPHCNGGIIRHLYILNIVPYGHYYWMGSPPER